MASRQSNGSLAVLGNQSLGTEHDVSDHRAKECNWLPEKPEEPLQSDCCGTGCTPCVFDIYDEEMRLWEEECQRLKLGLKKEVIEPESTSKLQTQAVIPTEYRQFQIQSVTQDTHDSFLYRFAIPSEATLGLRVGQHIILRAQVDNATITRQYTPISELDSRGYFDVLIKIYDEGRMSQYIKTWKVGHMVDWRGPFGTFSYKPNSYRRVVQFAAGTGVAPMIQVIREIVEDEDDETFVHLVYACKTYNDILAKTLLNKWISYWNFTVVYILSQDTAENTESIKNYGDKIIYERLTEEVFQEQTGEDINGTLLLTCGTKSFDKDMVNYAKRKGFSDQNIFKF